jgi:hypothetical protein
MATKNLDELNNQKSVREREGVQMEFWTQFLKEMNRQSSVMSNVNPTTEGWIPLALGLSGVSVNLVVTQKYARSEVYINRGSWDANKKAFDYFYSHKDKIEKLFGASLIWERKDDKVVSRIKIQLDNVSVANRKNWSEINEFLTNTSIRMKESISPYIGELRNILNR